MSLYFYLYTLIAVISDIMFYTCEEFEAWGSAHGTKYVEAFLCHKLPDIQMTISFTEGSQASSVFLLIKNRIKMKMKMSVGGIQLTGEKPNYWQINLSQCHSVHHKSHTDRSGIKAGPPRSKTVNYIVTVYKIFISYLTENIVCVHYEGQSAKCITYLGNHTCTDKMKKFSVQSSGIYAIYKDLNCKSTVVIICTITTY